MFIILLKSIFILIIYKIFFFKFLKFRKGWYFQLLVVYIISLVMITDNNILSFNFMILIESFVFFSSFIIAYLLFLTLVFNDSPTLFYLFKSKKKFLQKKFIFDRRKKLITSGLINKQNKITKKGLLFIIFFEKLSWLFFLEKK